MVANLSNYIIAKNIENRKQVSNTEATRKK